MRRDRLIIGALLVALLLVACGSGRERKTATYMDEAGVTRLCLPEVPPETTDSVAFLLDHYWDRMAFVDTLTSHDEAFMRRALVGYIPYLTAGDSSRRATAVSELMHRAEVDTLAYVHLMDLSEELLYDRGRREEYLPFAQAIVASSFPTEWDKARPQVQIRTILLNRPGTLASDFDYFTPAGDSVRLSDLRGKPLLLFIYNSPCHLCHGEADTYGRLDHFSAAVEEGRVRALAVDKWGNEVQWLEEIKDFPKGWLHGRNYRDFEGTELYVIDHVPTVFLLDPDGRVLLRDTDPMEVESMVSQLE